MINKKYNISLLYVEDDELTREGLSSILSYHIDELYFASNGEEGYELYKSKKPDLVLSDIKMPKLDGIAMSKKIKQYDPLARIILLTAFNESEYLLESIKLNIDAYITKPVNIEELFDNIQKIAEIVELKKEKNKINNLLDEYKKTVDLSSIVSKTNPKGIITFVNEQFENISGYKKEELLGKSHNIVRHEDTPAEVFKEMWHTIRVEKKPWYGKIKNKKKDGGSYYVKTVINPILDEDGNILEFIAVRSDITELEETKLKLEDAYKVTAEKYTHASSLSRLYEDAFDKSSIIIRVTNDMKIKYVNDMFCELTGYSKEELIGESYWTIKHPKTQKNLLEKAFISAKEDGIWKGQLKGITKDKKDIHYISTIVSIKDINNNLIEYLGIRLDITKVIALHEELEETQREIIYTMGEIGETRSKETGFHVKRVAEYSKLLALKYGLSESESETLRLASPMHDIGKVGIPDSILNKPGKLTVEEYDKMKEHTQIGYELLKNSTRDILKASAIVAYEHHEKWDGSGYPRGLSGENIHIFGRITAICDVFDALAHERPYKKAWELDRIIALFKEERAKHFDPTLIDLFLENIDDFLEIKNAYEGRF
ncbi:HD domain-containing phosphohydrolase [Halarcobacter bivalviorum]|uniref:HD domain-containing phosphohydrolase n=1 Tax=Halarcobacter bivalviorum TaxID=663364 RepID=UPI00100BA7C2|nr:HD domain-containing phosphohydrolase [Halarcobacter bivalviorum]RXK04178.1 regulator [Halarcobacter bivalviorum]